MRARAQGTDIAAAAGPSVAANASVGPIADTPLFSQRRRSSNRPQTPNAKVAMKHAVGSNGKHLTGEVKRPKTVISSLAFSGPIQPASTPVIAAEDGDVSRGQRKSKVEAISKLDRAGTPLQLHAGGPTATSFIPRQDSPLSVPLAGPSAAKNPLYRSAVPSPPFNIESVRTEAPRYPPNRSGSRLFGLQECPIYYPTLAQWSDPMAYMETIAPEAKAFGICKIVPPEGWRMPFALDTDTFRFKTRLQRLNSLEATSRARINFLEQLTLYHQQGDSKLVLPVINRKALDLYQLRHAVYKIGGFEEVNRMKGWPVIAKTLGYEEKYASVIRSAYLRIVLPFDTFSSTGRSVSGSPLTPVTLTNTNVSRPPGFIGESPGSPTQPRMKTSAPTRMGQSRGSPPVKPLNLPIREASPISGPSRTNSATPSLTTLRIKVPGFSSRDGSESELSDEDSPKKQIPTVPYQKGEVCEVCQGGEDEKKILLCDSCDKGFHIYCLNPPLSFVPANEEWYCGPCLFAQGDGYGFDEGEDHSISSFQARDQAFAEAWWAKHPRTSTPDATSRTLGSSVVTEDDVEREFWRLTEDEHETVEIEYGADVHSTTHGSGSPTPETHPLDVYSADGWNLNNMPILPESLLRYIKSDISGMTVPWIYVGMLFSAFCWHNEDHYTYSVNYMHWGETKTWYGVPGSDAEKFQDAMRAEAPDLFEQQPGLLYNLTTMMNPRKMSNAGVNVVACDQRPNEFVITFPKAYHCGFNHGINLNEAVNFALPDWLRDGKECITRYKEYSKAPVFSHNELLISITLYSETIKTAIWLLPSLAEMVREETARRDRLRMSIPLLTEQLVEEDCAEEQYQCCICKGFCYLSQVICACTKLVACVEHAEALCNCAPIRRTLRKRYSEAQLDEILAIVKLRATLPDAWNQRFATLLELPRPALKSLRAVLAEGEKIAHPIAEVQDLRIMVDRANTWVDKVTNLTSRKSTGRRKGVKHRGEDDSAGTLQELKALLVEANQLGFDAPEILQLRLLVTSVESFKNEAMCIMSTGDDQLDLGACETALILGKSLNIDLPEIQPLQAVVDRLTWFRKVDEEVDDRTLELADVQDLLKTAQACAVPTDHPTMVELRKRRDKGLHWQTAVDKLLSSKLIDIVQVSALIDGQELVPTSIDTMRSLENIRKTAMTWQASARLQLSSAGSSNAAQRLCKAVRTASGPLGKVHIPEIATLQSELDLHAMWYKELAQALHVVPKQVTSSLERILHSFQKHLSPDDHYPSADLACFCRDRPDDTMITCTACNGCYHPHCVQLGPSANAAAYRCPMCERSSWDDRPSLNEISAFSVSDTYHFIIQPPEVELLCQIVDLAVPFARLLVPLIDPFGSAVVCRDFELLSHWARKLFYLPLALDAQHTLSNKRIVFEDWLYKRMHDAKNPAKARTRPRKPKLVLRQAKEGLASCICTSSPADALVTVSCAKCRQIYHATCVRAPVECLGPDAKTWRCPCCSVKEGKRFQQGGATIRVQMSDRWGTDEYVDYRTTINTFATSVLEYRLPSLDCILLECIKFVPPIIPDDFKPPSIDEVRAGRHDDVDDLGDDGRKKRRKVEPASKALATKLAVDLVNGHSNVSTIIPASSWRPDNSAQGQAQPIIAPPRDIDTPSVAPSTQGPPFASIVRDSWRPSPADVVTPRQPTALHTDTWSPDTRQQDESSALPTTGRKTLASAAYGLSSANPIEVSSSDSEKARPAHFPTPNTLATSGR